MLHARILHCCTLALLHITRGFSMQEERAKVNASIAEPQTRLSERALPSMAPVRAAAPRACCTVISRCPSHDESPRSAAAPPSGRRACPRVACGPCAQVTVTAADCGGAAFVRTARKVTEDSNEAKKKHDEARAKLQEVGPAGCPRRAAPVSSRVACCVLHSQRLSRLRPAAKACAEALHRLCARMGPTRGSMGTLGPYTPQPDRAGAVRQQTRVVCRMPCLLHVACCMLHVTRAGDQRQAAVRERGGRGQAR
jgi:hypothetical protein